VWVAIGTRVRDVRLARRWSAATLAQRAGVSLAVVYLIEAGEPTSLEAVVRVATALNLRLDVELTDGRRRPDGPSRSVDPVHSAIGELEVAHLRRLAFGAGVDEPYQHFQFAGRADVVAWDLQSAALLHIENRTRFPDFQEMAGAFNSKRAYLAASIGGRLGIARWSSQTHVIAALWSAEVLHAIRRRPESFRSLCPDPPDAFTGWWTGRPPLRGLYSTLIVVDPLATGRQRQFIGLDQALSARPRHLGYADAAAKLDRAAVA
jgi:transcriptional regulator with XRE-family HTH domain